MAGIVIPSRAQGELLVSQQRADGGTTPSVSEFGLCPPGALSNFWPSSLHLSVHDGLGED